MSMFYGTLKGRRSPKTCTGHTGITAVAQSWDGSVSVQLEAALGSPIVTLCVGEGSTSSPRVKLWSGRLSDLLRAGDFK